MQLLDVTLSGFKSFAHKTTFRFDAGLTAIIGPNGSGKSNLAEAIRWVLGEQSLKNLRGKKSEDVIFAGSAGHARAGGASVTLTLSNESGRLGLEAAEVALSRRIDRSGESEYTINGELVRLLDVQQLLAEAGIGAKSYTVISQGTVDRYLQATPVARRELFDEATGIKALQLKLQQAERKLAQVHSDSHELQTIQQELAPRLRVLKRQITRHEERQALEKEYQDKATLLFHHGWHTAWAALQQAQTTYATSQEEVTRAAAQRATVEQQLLAAAQRSTPVSARERLAQELTQAEAQYQQAYATYEQAAAEKKALAQALHVVRVERQRAEAALVAARKRLTTTDHVGTLRELLMRCQAVVSRFLEGKSPAPEALTRLQEEIEGVLQATHSERTTIEAAEMVVEHMSGPLQAVARLQAIEQERATRLEQLPDPVAPTADRVRALRAQVHALPADAHPSLHQDLQQTLSNVREQELVAERARSAAQAAVEHATTQLAEFERAIMREKGNDFLQHVQHTPPPHEAHVPTQDELTRLAARLSVLGEIDPLALQEYQEVSGRYERLEQQLRDIQETRERLLTLKRSLTTTMHAQFRTQFTTIDNAFRGYFKTLFDGGSARLEIVDAASDTEAGEGEEALVAGVEIIVHPPGKKPQHVGLLSGGEKALTSLALLLAILEVQQPPFLVLDEVDAALDEANSYRFASLLKEKSATTQCIVISHNRETMTQADVLYGITMQDDGVSKAYSVKVSDVAEAKEIQV